MFCLFLDLRVLKIKETSNLKQVDTSATLIIAFKLGVFLGIDGIKNESNQLEMLFIKVVLWAPKVQDHLIFEENYLF